MVADSSKKVVHIHGSIGDPDSIILTDEQYRNIYQDKKYQAMLSALLGTKKIIFIGFSFDDPYVKRIFKYYFEIFNGTNYIMFPKNSKTLSEAKELKSKFGLEVIYYNCPSDNHVAGIRQKLQEICSSELSTMKTDEYTGGEVVWSTESLFFRKLKLAGVKDIVCDMAVNFYKNSELFIRQIKQLGFSEEQVEQILTQVFLKYQEDYISIYKKQRDSNDFVMRVQEDLSNLRLGRLVTNQTEPSGPEVSGLVHVLADDSSKEVWWGDDRFE